ncbi:MAG: thioredoxin domain-containing protein [Sedimentisphaerales bacterium]|nr:thioredoxin domain-containing protein [Sedimentisphaerales bacterium]
MASELDMSPDELKQTIDDARTRLFAQRKKRIHPYKDNKVLTDWNGLMIAALARGARVLDEPEYTRAAQKALAFIFAHMFDTHGRLLHRWRQGQAAVTAHLDDYAFLVRALLEMYETDFNPDHLTHAVQLNQDMIDHFWDNQAGGFYFTADDAEKLIVRQKEIYDGAVPSGNSIAMGNLLLLARITANTTLENKAQMITQAFARQVNSRPSAYTQLLCALDFTHGPTYEITIAGTKNSPDTYAMLKTLNQNFIPNKIVLLNTGQPPITQLAPYTKHQPPLNHQATAYICQNYTCKKPTTNPDEMMKFLTD